MRNSLPMDETFHIVSCNVAGIQGNKRRSKVNSHLLFPNTGPVPDIFMFQDTHSTPSNEKFWKKQTNSVNFYHHESSITGGLLIGVKRRVLCEHIDKVTYQNDNTDQFLVVYCKLNGVKYVLVNVYHKPRSIGAKDYVHVQFYDELSRAIRKYNCEKVIVCGDFNQVLTDMDKQVKSRNPDAILNSFVDTLGLCDIWRVMHPDSRRYTRHGKKSAARIDYIFVSGLVRNYTVYTSIDLAVVSDHSPVTCLIDTVRNDPGVGVWRFPNFLTQNKEYYSALEQHVKTIVCEYEVGNIGIWQSNREMIKTNPMTVPEKLVPLRSIWDTIKLSIRSFTQQFVKKLKLNQNVKFLRQIRMELEEEVAAFEAMSPSDERYAGLQDLIEDGIANLEALEDALHSKKFKGAFLRKSAYHASSSVYLFRKRSNPSGSIKVLVDKHSGMVCEDDDSVLDIAREFYGRLYRSPVVEDSVMSEFVQIPQDKKLSLSHKRMLEGDVTVDDMHQALKKMKNRRSPGSDGLTVEFYKTFWPIVGNHVCNSFHDAEHGKLSVLQRQGLIKLLPKPGKDHRYVENHRPITLLNVDYKIFTSVLTNRLNELLPSIVHTDQTGFVPGRTLSDSLLDTYAAISVMGKSNIPHAVLSLDIYKAFDSVSWIFVKKVLLAFGFPERFVNWWCATTNQKDVRVLNNGHLSDRIEIGCGLPQGDGLSPGIFILVMEMLGNYIRNNNNIQGLNIPELDIYKKLNMVADDTLLFLEANAKNFCEVNVVLDKFTKASGLRINNQKSIVLPICDRTQGQWMLSNSVKRYKILEMGELFKYLGVWVGENPNTVTDKCFEDVIYTIANAILSIYKPASCIAGRTMQLKTLVSSKLTYLFSHVPNFHSAAQLRACRTLMLQFLWDYGPHRLNMDRLQGNYNEGGYSFLDPFVQEGALKLKWLAVFVKEHSSSDRFWVQLLANSFVTIPDYFLRCNLLYKTQVFNIIREGREHWVFPLFRSILRFWYSNFYINPQNDIVDNVQNILNSAFIPNDAFMITSPFPVVGLYKEVVDFLIQKDWYRIGDILCITEDEWATILQDSPVVYNRLQDWLDKMPAQWLDSINRADIIHFEDNHILCLMKDKFKTAYFRALLRPVVDLSKPHNEWSNLLRHPLLFFDTLFAKAKCISEGALRDFHVFFLWQAYRLRVSARKVNKRDLPVCSFCNNCVETYLHLFWQCRVVKPYWAWFLNICEDYYNVDDKVASRVNCLMSNFKLDILIWFSVIIKNRIWAWRCTGVEPSFQALFAKIDHYQRVAEAQAKARSSAGALRYYEQVWGMITLPTIREEMFKVS